MPNKHINKRNLEGTSGVYLITNKQTGDTYIGQSKNIEARWEEHKRLANIPLYKQINQYGIDNFEFSILEEGQEKLIDKEREYIIKHRPTLNETNIREYRRKVSKPVLQCDPETKEPIAEFPSQSEAQRATGVPQPQISACVSGRQPTAGGFVWKLVK